MLTKAAIDRINEGMAKRGWKGRTTNGIHYPGFTPTIIGSSQAGVGLGCGCLVMWGVSHNFTKEISDFVELMAANFEPENKNQAVLCAPSTETSTSASDAFRAAGLKPILAYNGGHKSGVNMPAKYDMELYVLFNPGPVLERNKPSKAELPPAKVVKESPPLEPEKPVSAVGPRISGNGLRWRGFLWEKVRPLRKRKV